MLSACGPERGGTAGADPAAAAIERVVAYLSRRPLEYDELWFVHQGAAHLGGSFPAWARTLRGAGPPDPAEQVLVDVRDLPLDHIEPLGPAPDVAPQPAEPFLEGHRASLNVIVRLLVLAGTCTPGDAAEEAELRALTGVRTHGYVLGHQAWALVVGAARGCFTGPPVERRRAAMARQLLAELRASPAITDLDIERAAVLCLIGACHWVPETWIADLLARQQPDGGWGDVTPPGVEPGTLRDEHAAALAFYALARRAGARGAAADPGR